MHELAEKESAERMGRAAQGLRIDLRLGLRSEREEPGREDDGSESAGKPFVSASREAIIKRRGSWTV